MLARIILPLESWAPYQGQSIAPGTFSPSSFSSGNFGKSLLFILFDSEKFLGYAYYLHTSHVIQLISNNINVLILAGLVTQNWGHLCISSFPRVSLFF